MAMRLGQLGCESNTDFVPQLFSVALGTPVEFNRWCQNCLDKTLFVADKECAYGLIGECVKCGEKAVASFTRTTTEGVA